MKIRIIVDVFSGRPNPVLELEGDEANQALSSLKPAARLTSAETGESRILPLGYRGLIVEQIDETAEGLPRRFRVYRGSLSGGRLAHRAADTSFEDQALFQDGLLQKLNLDARTLSFIRRSMASVTDVEGVTGIRRPPLVELPKPKCTCAPVYEPNWWNDGSQIQGNNNCYNYAANYRSDTFAQPGQAAGQIYTSLSCVAVKAGAVRDALIDTPSANNRCPGEGHLVALVVAPGVDFHWYRKGRNGLWTHKPGSTAVTNIDNSGNSIKDPRTANRGMYTNFCTFMVVKHGHIKIQ